MSFRGATLRENLSSPTTCSNSTSKVGGRRGKGVGRRGKGEGREEGKGRRENGGGRREKGGGSREKGGGKREREEGEGREKGYTSLLCRFFPLGELCLGSREESVGLPVSAQLKFVQHRKHFMPGPLRLQVGNHLKTSEQY